MSLRMFTPRFRGAATLATLLCAGFLASCGEAEVDLPSTEADALDDFRTGEYALFYEHEVGFCEDTDELGAPYAPARPLWSDFAGNHYDGITHTDGSQSIRYPDYENVSHNLAILESLQFLLSMVQNVSAKVESAQTFLEDEEYLDATYGLIPQVDGHCVCIDGSCDPNSIMADVEDVVNDLIDVHQIEDILEDYLTQKIDATIMDLDDLLQYFEDLIDPSAGLIAVLQSTLYTAIEDEIAAAETNMIGPVADACDPTTWTTPSELADAIEAAVNDAVSELEAELNADFQTVKDAVELAISTPSSVLNQLKADIQVVKSYFEDVSSFQDLINLDWAELIGVLEDMVPFYEDIATDIQDAITDVTGVWDDISNFDTRVQTLADDLYTSVMDELEAAGGDVLACVDAIEDAASYLGGYDPSMFLDDLTDALETVVDDTWDEMRTRVLDTWQSIEDRITGIGLEDATAIFDIWAADARSLITGTIEGCYMRGTRPECFDFCSATGATAQDDFIWMPVDFLQDPAATAAGAASGALFALEQSGWLDDVREWVSTQMETDLGAAFTSVLGFLGDFAEAIEDVIEFLGDAFEYVDLFTEGYHLGAYNEVRPDLHMCIGYYGHGAYAQMGALGGDTFSIGARYSSHNLSEEHRVQFRSGGFAVSAFGYDLSLLPGIEFNTQLDGWKLWDQTRPFGIPMGATIDPDTVGRLDVFNVVPMDRYPFGMTPGVPIGAFLVRDLYPSRPTGFATPEWPRPGVAEPWELRSTAVMSMGLNLEFHYPPDGPEYIELPDIPIIPGILTVVPSFGYQLGVGWVHDTNNMRDRVQEMINANLPAADHLTSADFGRDMHAMQAPDLTADNQTWAYVEPSLNIEAFLGFKVWKIKVGAGARVGLAVNIRPGGTGGILDMNAALADALLHSNPPADAPCDPIWNFEETYECTNTTFPTSDGVYSCSPAESGASCCVQILVREGRLADNYRLCIDEWTGIDREYCSYLNLPREELPGIIETVEGLPGFLSGIKTRLLNVLALADYAEIRAEWRADASCAERECGNAEQETLLDTGGVNIQSLSECEQFGYCTYEDGTIEHDLTLDQCESGDSSWQMVSSGTNYTCAIRATGGLYCWRRLSGAGPVTVPSGSFVDTDVSNAAWCAVNADGSVHCEAGSSFGAGVESGAPVGGNFVQVGVGDSHACAVSAGNEVTCWNQWSVWPTADWPLMTQVESSYIFSCGIRTDNVVECWGANGTQPILGPYYPLGDHQFTDIAMTDYLGVCGVNTTGAVMCGSMPDGFGGFSACSGLPTTTAPAAGSYVDIEGASSCGACATDSAGGVTCWGDSVTPASFSGPVDVLGGYGRGGQKTCGVLTDGSLECVVGTDYAGFPEDEEGGLFSEYTCRTITDPELLGWEGDGCHPLQQGFPSACGCSVDDDCAAGETCSEEGQCTDGGPGYSCACDGGSCPAGRTCVDGACALECVTDTDCAGARECIGGACAPPHGIPYSEEITWGMDNVDAPAHVVSSYAMSDILATLTLTVNLYVEMSFKLFGKERKWRILDFNRGWDLGSTWKGWYQPGLEAFYQDECASPDLLESVTNRYPRSLTSNPYDNAFDASGITDALGICGNGGVCRYQDPLPASETDPADYAYGNVGNVNDFLEHCLADYPSHMENPEHSSTDDIVGGIIDTWEFGHDVTLDVWAHNQFCVDGVVWDEWIAGLEPAFNPDGSLADPGLLGDYDCAYDDPVTGTTHTFECGNITAEMMAIWGCLDIDANLFAQLLSSQFPGAVTSHPTEGSILNVDVMFDAVLNDDPLYGPGLSYDYNLSNMVGTYRFWDSPFPISFNNVGEFWLQSVDACFSQRFDDPTESGCECVADSDCLEENGERCTAGYCEMPLYSSPDDDDPSWAMSECSIVYLNAEVGACCGDGIVQSTAGYSEECDEGIDGGPTCNSNCELIDEPGGSCCMGDGVCYENLNVEECAADGGTFNAGLSCDEMDYCDEDTTGGGDTGYGACCTASGCLEGLSGERCEVLGTWYEDQSCEDVDFCDDTVVTFGACCVDGDCFDGISNVECADHGTFSVDQTCAEIDYCADPEPTGGCCLPTGACVDDVTNASCDMFGGTWTEGAPCTAIDCGGSGGDDGACCIDGECLDGITGAECEERGGDWNAGVGCVDIDYCREPEPVGACCLGDECVDALTELLCLRRGGIFNEGLACVEVECSAGPDEGACCVDGGCVEATTADGCEADGGEFYSSQSCEEVDYCREPVPTGACCIGDECVSDMTELDCRRRDGSWSEGLSCEEVDCTSTTLVGACCIGDACLEAVTAEKCEDEGGAWNVGESCEDIDYCREPTGACCVDGSCVDATEERACEILGGAWSEGATCEEVDCEAAATGSCCVDGACIEEVTEAKCDDEGGVFNAAQTCEDVDYCRDPVELGACCNGRECIDAVDAILCERLSGRWYAGESCEEIECGSTLPPTGACCLESGLCLDEVTEEECTDEGGVDWHEGTECVDCGCSPVIDVPDTPAPSGCASAPANRGPFALALTLIGLATLRRRR